MLYCVPGIASAYRRHGPTVTGMALQALAQAFEGHVLRYAGQISRGLFITYAKLRDEAGFDNDAFVNRLSMNTQQQWMRKAAEQISKTNQASAHALAEVMISAYRLHRAG